MAEQRDLIDFDDDLPELLQRVGAEHIPAGRWPQTLADLVDVTEAALTKAQLVPADEAKQAARHIVAALAYHLGAQPIYLPRGDALKTALQHVAIWHAWDGRAGTKYALARQYNMSVRSIERVIAEQAALHRDRFQGSLFADSSEP